MFRHDNHNLKVSSSTSDQRSQKNISSAISGPVNVVSKLVNFSLSLKLCSNQLKIKNVCADDTLNLPQQKVAQNDIKKRWSPLETSDSETSLVIGADLPQLRLYYGVVVGEKDQSVGMLTKLEWVLLDGEAEKGQTNVTLNHVKTDGLQKLVQKFWEIESYPTLPQNDVKLLPKKDMDAIKILQSTSSKVQNIYSVGLLWKEHSPELPNTMLSYLKNAIVRENIWEISITERKKKPNY